MRNAPMNDPPYDDELAVEVWAPAPQRTFSLGLPGTRPGVTRAEIGGPPRSERAAAFPDVSPVGTSRAGVPTADGSPTGTDPSAAIAGASADAKLAVRRFVNLCVEVLNGFRPAAHLRRLSHPLRAPDIMSQAVVGSRRVAELRRAARAADRRVRRAGPVGVLKLQLCEPRPGAVEAAVLLITGERTWAMALRLESCDDIWNATVLRLL
jgi:hypothetical protein